MSENDSLLQFTCACGKPVAAPVELAGQKLHCPYEGCDAFIMAPPLAAVVAEAKPAGDAPKQSRFPRGKGLRGGKPVGPSVARKTPNSGNPTPSDAAAERDSTPVPPPAKAKNNAVFFIICSVVTVGVFLFINAGKGKSANKPKVGAAFQPAPAVPPAPTTPAASAPAVPPVTPPVIPTPTSQPVAPKPRAPLSADDADAIGSRLASGIEARKKKMADEFNALVVAAESGGVEALLSLAEAYEEGNGTVANPTKARVYLLQAAEKDSSRALDKLANMEKNDNPAKAAEYVLKAAGIVSKSKGKGREDRLQAYADRLVSLNQQSMADQVLAMMREPHPTRDKNQDHPAVESSPSTVPAP